MKRLMILAAATLLSSAAIAQTIELAPEQRTKIKTYVTTHKTAPVTAKERVTVGSTLPANVHLQPVPSDWGPGVAKYQYVYTGDDVVLVDPAPERLLR